MMKYKDKDLLGRSDRVPDWDTIGEIIKGKGVLITGAGGTIGSGLSYRISWAKPLFLVLMGHSELPLYTLEKKIRRRWPFTKLHLVLGDVRDVRRMVNVLEDFEPDIVIHTAAIKHVNMAEYHVCEAVLTNIIGTTNMVRACQATGVDRMILVSTDKAVNPISMMGATKQIAEMICHAELRFEGETKFTVVRLVNVIGSTGSVSMLFADQIDSGGPVTITDREVDRYFITRGEAADIIIRSIEEDDGIKNNLIVAVNPCDPISIEVLAKRMIKLSRRADIEIEHIGLKKGESLHESMFHDWEGAQHSDAGSILLGTCPQIDGPLLYHMIGEISTFAKRKQTESVINLIEVLLPNYTYAGNK